ncbi:photoreceptor cilium actin regulator [Centrocercus urophasianus]|uniref:photoreceptor cilium actin regulator n=1 Tax=Centrocercus urophasianus TaxID=9002 RepID=UPI001C64F075|nr:photoreceptor cilium actin regulator [Centrocercus urophasianus]
MGCTPSHSEIVNTLARSGLKALNKPKGVLHIDPTDKGIPLLVKGSSCYSFDELQQYGVQRNDCLIETKEKTSERDKSDHLQCSSNSHPKVPISREDKVIERTATEAEVISKLIESQKHITEAIQIRKQSSCESEASVFILDNKNESNAKQILKKGKKPKNQKSAKQGRLSKTKEKSILSPCETEEKVDFPELLVKAHQSAYAYLNPNLSKYEAILHMADQAAQTQLFLQQMVSFLVLRFDEINQLLEEIANDGENLLKNVGGNLAWPSEKGDLKEHPDLLQQLLQYTINKMQLLNGTLASLTSDALQETCNYLQTAASNLEGKLKAKQMFDERLLQTVRLLEASTVGNPQFHGDDRTLCSEDSGIGVDNESLKDFSPFSHLGAQASLDSSAHGVLSQKHSRMMEHIHNGTRPPGTATSHNSTLEMHFKDVLHSSVQSREGTTCRGGIPEGISTMAQDASLSKSHSCNSFQSDSTQEHEHFQVGESIDFPSDDDDEGSTLGEDDNTSLSEMGKDALPKRPQTSPEVTDDTKRQSIKRTENAEAEEMILKMKDAISEKIKFVPAKSRHKEWMEDESGTAILTARPSTATGRQKTYGKHRRSRSEESLRSQAEDPTLLELQRTQKELSKRLEMFYEKKETDNNKEPRKLRTTCYLQDEQVTSRSSSKLKACLSKNFSILPNQDKVPSYIVDQNPAHQLDEKRDKKPLKATMPTQETSSGNEENKPSGTQTLSGSSCAPRQSVKKLIETFSPTDEFGKAAPLKSLGPVKCVRKFGLPVIPPTVPFQRGLVPLNVKHRISPVEGTNLSNNSGVCSNFPNAFPPIPAAAELSKDAKEETDEDIENLPPPPPEMLIDSTFDSCEMEETARIEGSSSEDAKKPAKTEFQATKRTQVSPKMRASLQSIDLLPSKNINGPNVAANKVLRNSEPRDDKLQIYSLELNPTNVHIPSQEEILATQRKEAADLYKQTHKIIPLQNPSGVSKPHSNSSESMEANSPTTSVPHQKHGSPDSLRRNEKGSVFSRRVSPARTPPPSPPTEKRLFSPPTHHRHSLQAFSSPQPSSPTMQRKPSPPASPRAPSPPSQKKLPSPPAQRKLLSPPAEHKQSSSSPHRPPGSPAYRRDTAPAPFPIAPSPPTSPSRSYRGSRAGLDAGDEPQPSSTKKGSNVHSIFCPATSSLFEARPPPAPSKPSEEVTGQPEASKPSQKSSLLFQQLGARTRKLSLSAANPQPFVKRSFSDRRPGVRFFLPAPVSAASEPALNQASMDESPRKAGDSWSNPCAPEIKESNRSASHPELYIVGQRLQRD